MRVQNLKTKKPYDITGDQWEKIKKSGEASKYKVISTEETTQTPAIPEGAKGADLQTVLGDAKAAYELEDWTGALELYEQASKIKSSKATTEKIKELKEKLA